MKVIQAIKFVFKKTFQAAPTLLVLYSFFIILLSLTNLISIIFLKLVIDSITNNKSLFGLSLIGIVLFKLIIDISLKWFYKIAEYIWNIIDLKQVIGNTAGFIDKLSQLDLANFENAKTSDKIWRTYNRIAWQIKYYLDTSFKFFSNLIELSVSLIIFFVASPINALIIILVNLIVVLVRSGLGTQTFNIFKADSETRRKYEYTSTLVTIREILIEIKQFHGFEFVKRKILSLFEAFAKKQYKLFKKSFITLSIVELLPIVAIFAFLISIVQKLQSGIITPGSFIFFFSNILFFNSSLNQLSFHLSTLLTDGHFIHDAIDFFNIKPNIAFPVIKPNEEKILHEKIKKPTLTVENLSFKYPNSDRLVLKNINLKIPYGQNIALIGENGAGKTTLVKLLLRVYDPTEGNIFINDVNLKEIPENLLFETYSTLFQTFGKFYLTIRENMELATGKKLTDEDYIKALKMSNAWNYVKDFPKQLDQQLGANYTDGTDLSGGQWQQLAIGRALTRKTPVLILDEPTSSIDAKAEMEIFDRLNKETRDSTVLFISHRFSTIKDAQRIIVIDKGKIIEDGNHEKLMKNKNKYATLYTLQAKRYDRE